MAIGPMTGTTGPMGTTATRGPHSQGIFTVPEGPAPDGAEEATPAAETAGTAAVSRASLLTLQEVDSPTERDRRAHRHAEDMLEALKRLQLAMLGTAPHSADVERLTGLLTALPVATHPGLRAAVAAVAIRVEVEIARYAQLRAV